MFSGKGSRLSHDLTASSFFSISSRPFAQAWRTASKAACRGSVEARVVSAIFLAIKCFQSSGAYDFVKSGFALLSPILNVPAEVFSIAIIKPLSNSASLGIFTDIIKTTGPNSTATLTSAVIIGSAETTFYVLAVYLGAASVKKTRYLVPVCVLADIVGIIVAITVVKLMFR